MGHHAACGQNDGIFAVSLLRGRLPLHCLKMGLAVRMIELVALIQTWRSRMFRRRTGPEDAFFAVDSVPCYPVIIADTSLGSHAQLVKDPALTYQITNGSLVSGGTFTGNLARTAGSSVGSYAISQARWR